MITGTSGVTRAMGENEPEEGIENECTTAPLDGDHPESDALVCRMWQRRSHDADNDRSPGDDCSADNDCSPGDDCSAGDDCSSGDDCCPGGGVHWFGD